MGITKENLAINVKRLRESLGLTQSELAELVGISDPALQKIEYGTTKSPRRNTLNKLAEHLKTTVATLEDHPAATTIKGSRVPAASLTPELLAEIKEATRESVKQAIADSKGLPNQFETISDLEHIKSLIDGLSHTDKLALGRYITESAIGDLDPVEPAVDKRKLRR